MTTTVDSADLGLSRALRRRGELVLTLFAPLWSLAAIAGTVAVLVVADLPQLVAPVVCAIVGIHFLPLARLFDQQEYRSTATGLLVGAIGGLVIALFGPSDETSRVVVGACAAATLWVTSVLLSQGGWRRQRPRTAS